MTGPDLYNLFAATQGVPEGWRWYEVRAVRQRAGDGVLIKGAVCTAVYSRGPRKGQTDWHKLDRATVRELFATFAQLDAVRDTWERETGKCAKCGGDGQEVESVGTRAGVTHRTYRPCTRCDASGKAPAATAEVSHG